MKAQLIRAITATIAQTSGRHYRLDLERLDEPSLRELQRLLRDLEDEKQIAVAHAKRLAITMPWRR